MPSHPPAPQAAGPKLLSPEAKKKGETLWLPLLHYLLIRT